MFFDSYVKICQDRGYAPTAVLKNLGISKSAYSGWKNGGEPSNRTKKQLADFFGISVGELINADKETPIPQDERLVTDDDIKFALWGDSTEVDDADLEDVKRYAAFVKERKKGNA